MNVLFLTLLDFSTIDERGIYTDLMREFVRNGHDVYIVSPTERRKKEKTRMVCDGKTKILKLRIGNTQKTNIIEKGISTLLLETQFKIGIKKNYNNIKFDLILYSTPPITLQKSIAYVKKRDGAKTYLMLKDIFPQNAVDLGMLSKKGIKSFAYKYFRHKEKQLYRISDRIGCMSQANVDYLRRHNPEIPSDRIEICPNSIEVQDISLQKYERDEIRRKYNLPIDKKLFVYGGNLGKPQDVPFIVECLRAEKDNDKVFFLIAGDGTEYDRLETFVNYEKPENVCLRKRLPRDDFDRMIVACDAGLIFLDHRFTIPNFPSRLLSYMQAGIPVLACTDKNTDVGKVILEGGFGLWCESNEINNFCEAVSRFASIDTNQYGNNALRCVAEEYTSTKCYETIVSKRKPS